MIQRGAAEMATMSATFQTNVAERTKERSGQEGPMLSFRTNPGEDHSPKYSGKNRIETT